MIKYQALPVPFGDSNNPAALSINEILIINSILRLGRRATHSLRLRSAER